MAKKQSLGRGLSNLIPTTLDTTVVEEDKNRVQKLLISDIVPNKTQPRGHFDEQAISELASSVKQHGILQPIIVIGHGNKYKIIAGERRWRAAQKAGLSHMPAIVRSLKELEQIELSLIENIQRVDLSPLEQAATIYRLQNQFSLTLDEVSRKLGKAHSTVSNITRLLGLPESAKQALADHLITEGHARAILSLHQNPSVQNELLERIINEKLTVRQAEQFVQNLKKPAAKQTVTVPADAELQRKMSSYTGVPVAIKRVKKGGNITIRFKNDDELEALTKKLT